jgi:ABC-type sugar transport system ATPase subunit
MSGIEIRDLSKNYGETRAIRSMTLAIPDGTFCVLLGPSGCGKSTTLNCVSGLEDVTSGTIKIGGKDVTYLPPHQRNVAMVFQSSLLYPHLTARQNILMSLKKTSLSKTEVASRVAHAVSVLDIEPVLDKKPAVLSGGERQRVAMAKAIVREPAAFLLDEPLAALDAALRQTLRAELVALQRKLGTTTILVTHDQVEAMTMGDMIVVMNEGNVEQVGTPDEIYNRPATRFVAGFIGSPPMNFFDGRLVRDDRGKRLDLGRFSIRLPGDGHKGEGPTSLGIRPQHMRLAEAGSEEALQMTVTGLERLGRESVLILEDADGTRHRLLVEPSVSREMGETVEVELRLEHGVFFP